MRGNRPPRFFVPILVVFLVVISVVPLLTVTAPDASANGGGSSWWDMSWARRRPITISNAGSALVDYQIPVTVDTASLISAGKMQASGADIRFVGPTLADNFEYGAENVFSSKNSEWGSMNSVALDSCHALIAYRNASGYGAAVIATISGTGAAATVSFGSEYPFNQASTRGCVTVALSQTKVFIAYVDEGNSNKGTAIVATVSGSTITYGSEYLFNDAVSDFLDAAWIGENVLITYQDTGNSNKGTATVATVSGSTITYGSEYLFNDAETWVSGVDTLSTNKALITCTAFAGEWFCTAKVATVTGLTVSFGSGTIYDYSPGGGGSPVALSPTRVVVLYGFEDNDFQNNLVPLTISGTTVIAGVRYTFSSHGEEMNTRVWGLDESHFFAIYLDSDNNYFGTSSIGTVLGSGASANVTLGPKRVIGDTYTSSAAVFDPSYALISYSGVNGPGIAFVATRSEVTAELSHWIEPGTINTASTKIWVRVPSIPAGSSTIYMYYGNSSATSDGAQLKGIWHFDEGSETTTYDNSGNGNNGTLVNGPTWTSGKIESAVNFDGTDDYVSVPDADSLDFTTAMTVMAWVKLDDITADHWVASKSGYVDGEFATWRIGYISWSGFVFLFREWDGVVSSTTFPTTGTWYHIAATYDGSHTKIYVNGVLEGTLAYSTPIEVTDYPLYIGSGSWTETPELFFDGTIDEVRVYYRALSAVEISDIYNMTFIRVLDNTNAIWHLDEVSGTTAYDSSGNNHNGTLLPSGSGPTWTSGEFANALSFDGIDDYDNVGNLGARPIKGTISYWMKSDAVVSSRNTMSTGGAGNIGFRFEQATGGGFVVAIGNDGGSFTGHTYSTSLQASIWYHVVLTWDSSQSKVWGYLNGVQKFADSQSLWATNLAQVKLGVGFGSRWFDGILDEVAIWNRDLSAGEVLDLYNNYGYTTTNYLGRVLVRKYTSPEPTASVGAEEGLSLLSPQNGTMTNDNKPIFRWENVRVFDNYEVWVDNDSNFSSPLAGFPDNTVENTYDLSVKLPAGLPDENWFWKVYGYLVGGTTDPTTWTLLIDTVAPPAPSLISPADGTADNVRTRTFDWSDVTDTSRSATGEASGLRWYEIWIDNDPDFSSPENLENVVASQYTTTLAGENYFWRVRAIDLTGNVGLFSSTRSVVILDFSISASPNSLELMRGTDGAVTLSISFLLGVPENATLSGSWVGTAPTGVDNSFSPSNSLMPFSTTLTFTTTFGTTPGTFTYRVKARGDNSKMERTTDVTVIIVTMIFSIDAYPYALSIMRTDNVTATVSVTFLIGIKENVALSGSWIDNISNGLSASFNPQQGLPPYTSTLKFTAGNNATAGTVTYRVSGTGGGLNRTADITITISTSLTITVSTDSAGYEKGGKISISGTAKNPKGNPVGSGTATISIVNGSWRRTVTSSIANGAYSASYFITFDNPEGTWTISVTAVDNHGNVTSAPENVSVTVVYPVAYRYYVVTFLSPTVGQTFSRGQVVTVTVQITEDNRKLGGANVVFMTPRGDNVPMAEISFGVYSATYTLPWDVSTGDWYMSVIGEKTAEGVFKAGASLTIVGVTPATLSLTLISPTKREFETGETVEISVEARYSDGSPVDEGVIVVNKPGGENLPLTAEGGGIYGATYIIGNGEVGTWNIHISAVDAYGNSGSMAAASTVIVPAGASSHVTRYWQVVLAAILGLVVASAFVARGSLRVRRLGAIKRENEEIKRLRKDAIIKYFKDGSISRADYDDLIKEYASKLTDLDKEEGILMDKLKKKKLPEKKHPGKKKR